MDHQYFLDLAAQNAAQINPHLTNPNPRVGCVVVHKNKVISSGAHKCFGQAHAEVNAIHALDPGIDLRDCTVYITLEPCVKFSGKQTPSCTDLLLKLAPAGVVVGALDPHFPGEGLKALKNAGINVEVLKTDHHAQLNPWFSTWITQRRPHITLKIAQSLDGKITHSPAAHKAGKRSITGKKTQHFVHRLRAQNSAILTTTATILEDNPRLDVRLKDDAVLKTSNPDIIIMGNRGLPGALKLHQVTGRKIHTLQSRDFNQLISLCREHRLASVMTECGSTMNAALLKAELVDEIQIFTAPTFMGNEASPSFLKPEILDGFYLESTETFGDDFLLTYKKNPLST